MAKSETIASNNGQTSLLATPEAPARTAAEERPAEAISTPAKDLFDLPWRTRALDLIDEFLLGLSATDRQLFAAVSASLRRALVVLQRERYGHGPLEGDPTDHR